jgi:hypothetical protein
METADVTVIVARELAEELKRAKEEIAHLTAKLGCVEKENEHLLIELGRLHMENRHMKDTLTHLRHESIYAELEAAPPKRHANSEA